MLRLRDLRKSFGRLVAVDGLSLDIQAGEVFGLLGPNGAGKSTTVNIATGLLAPDSGAVDIAGAGPPTDRRARALLGVAPQALALYDELSAAENLAFFGRVYGLRGPALRARAAELLDLVGLADRARSRVRTFSGGMKRRLNLAAAIIHDPRLVLLDEPTAGVDPQSRHALFEVVRALQARGRTIVYITHYMEEVQRLCKRCAIIDKGRLLALDTVDSLIAQHAPESTIVVENGEGERRITTTDPVRELPPLLSAGGVRSVRVERPDLEAVFLHLTGRSLRD